MAQAKTHAFTGEAVRLAQVARALSHPGRLRLLEAIAARRNCICGELVEVMPLAQSTVSRHLKELKEAGLVRGTVDGPRSCFCLDEAAVAAARRDFARLFAALGAGDAQEGEDNGRDE